MIIKITFFINLLLYVLVISQSFFYMMAMTATLKKMQAATYIETRNLLTARLEIPLQVIYYSALASSVLLIAFCVVNPSGWMFICSVIAFLALLADAVLATRGNIPLNKQIASWTASEYPGDWSNYRAKWFLHYRVRQVINIAGFLCLLAGGIFGS